MKASKDLHSKEVTSQTERRWSAGEGAWQTLEPGHDPGDVSTASSPCLEPDPQHDLLGGFSCVSARTCSPEPLRFMALQRYWADWMGTPPFTRGPMAILGIFVTLIFMFIVPSLQDPWESASTSDNLIAILSVQWGEPTPLGLLNWGSGRLCSPDTHTVTMSHSSAEVRNPDSQQNWKSYRLPSIDLLKRSFPPWKLERESTWRCPPSQSRCLGGHAPPQPPAFTLVPTAHTSETKPQTCTPPLNTQGHSLTVAHTPAHIQFRNYFYLWKPSTLWFLPTYPFSSAHTV